MKKNIPLNLTPITWRKARRKNLYGMKGGTYLKLFKKNMQIKKIINKIICGDTLIILKQLPDECIDLIITSPPYYSLRKYGDCKEQIGLEETFEEYLKKILAIT